MNHAVAPPPPLPHPQAILLTAYEKMAVGEPGNAELAAAVGEVWERYARFMDAELQQRAVEYAGLAARPPVAAAALQPLPKWDKRTSLLLRRLAEKEVRSAGWAGGHVCHGRVTLRLFLWAASGERLSAPWHLRKRLCASPVLSADLPFAGQLTAAPLPHHWPLAGRRGGRAARAAGLAAGAAGG